jgi:DNA-directed RNA polymerase specialized sigma24 family protein
MLDFALDDLSLDDLTPDGLTRDAWDRFLRALAPEPSLAASRYERLRNRLIALYRWRRLPCPEDLADETFDRVALRLGRGSIVEAEVGAHLYGVARRIVWETSRRRRREQPLDPAAAPEIPALSDADDPLTRLCQCLDELPRTERHTLLAYEAPLRRDRVRRRRELAAELGIPINALRVRVHRLRARLVTMMTGDGQNSNRAAV